MSEYLNSGWHQLIFGEILTNIAILIAVIRYSLRMSRKYKRRIKFFFEKIDILWFDYGSRMYQGSPALEIHNKLEKELDEYVGHE